MTKGQKIGLTDQLLRDICVGDEVIDAGGVHYTIDRFGRAKPTSGGNEVPVRSLKGCEVTKPWEPAPADKTKAPARDPESEAIHQMYEAVDAAGDQMLVDKLRSRGWTVTCTKTVEKIVYEEVSL